MTLLKSSFLLLSILLMSCCSTTKNTDDKNSTDNSNAIEMEEKRMLEEGYKKGVIVTSEIKGDCPITIQILDDEAYYLDPINIAEMYKVIDGDMVWVKYRGLKMMNRCDKANPISLTEIKKRVE